MMKVVILWGSSEALDSLALAWQLILFYTHKNLEPSNSPFNHQSLKRKVPPLLHDLRPCSFHLHQGRKAAGGDLIIVDSVDLIDANGLGKLFCCCFGSAVLTVSIQQISHPLPFKLIPPTPCCPFSRTTFPRSLMSLVSIWQPRCRRNKPSCSNSPNFSGLIYKRKITSLLHRFQKWKVQTHPALAACPCRRAWHTDFLLQKKTMLSSVLCHRSMVHTSQWTRFKNVHSGKPHSISNPQNLRCTCPRSKTVTFICDLSMMPSTTGVSWWHHSHP